MADTPKLILTGENKDSLLTAGPKLNQLIDLANGHNAQLAGITKEKQQSPIQYYGFNQIYVDFPQTEGYSVASDISFADDREGATGKLFAFYFDSVLGPTRREVPYVGCKASELGAPVPVNITGGQLNHFVQADGIWYIGAGTHVYGFLNGIDQDPTLLSTITAVGQNGDQYFVNNLCIERDLNGVWYAWYATFDGANVGVRRATANSPSGPWTIEPGFWMLGSDIDPSLSWLRVYYVMKDKWGRLWSVAGAGRKWGGAGWPDKDDAASVWVSPVSSHYTKPTQWECVVDLPYFEAIPYGSPLINNAYAPSFLQDGDDWYLYANSGKYGKERILELKPNLSQSWTNQQAEAGDFYLGSILYPIEWSRAFIRDGTYKISLSGLMVNAHSAAQWHSVFFRMKDAETGEIFGEYILQNGAFAWESRPFQLSAIINGYEGRVILVETMYSVGAGQVEPVSQTSRLRGVSLSIEKVN